MRLLILLFWIAFSTLVKGRERDEVEEKGCEELHGQCISKNMTCHSTAIIHNSNCSSDKKCCSRPYTETADDVLNRLHKCKARKKCNKKQGVCKKQCAKFEKITNDCIRKQGCKCCIPRCKAKRKCIEAGGYCVKYAYQCKGTLSKDCKGNGCHCCVEGATCPYNISMADNTNLRQVLGCTWVVGAQCFPAIIVRQDEPWQMVLPVHENGENRVRIPENMVLTFACSGNVLTQFNTPSIIATCHADGYFVVNGHQQQFSISDMGCAQKVTSSINPNRGPCGSGANAVEHHIGFSISPGVFLPLIPVCFSTTIHKTTLWTQNTLRGHHIFAQSTIRINDWTIDPGFFSQGVDIKMNWIYEIQQQRSYLVGNGILSPQIRQNPGRYFAKGHLANRDDFVSQAGSDASMHYINALPMWQRFQGSGGNWRYIETWTKDVAVELDGDLRIFSGGLGVTTLTYNAIHLDFYLGEIVRNVGDVQYQEVPVPAVIWKLVVDETHGQAVIFFVSNNPQVNTANPGILCTNICHQIHQLQINNNISLGFTQCCRLDEPYFILPPDIPIVGNLPLLNPLPPN